MYHEYRGIIDYIAITSDVQMIPARAEVAFGPLMLTGKTTEDGKHVVEIRCQTKMNIKLHSDLLRDEFGLGAKLSAQD